MDTLALDNFEAANMSDLSEVQGGTNPTRCVVGIAGEGVQSGIAGAAALGAVGLAVGGPVGAYGGAHLGFFLGFIGGSLKGTADYCF
ncbi:Blp family class II bacteriocin [Streptococcus downei]|uniref:Bacteriocin class II with double-glycine leader peptide n=1 Tax=Streptococcus downei MFe28 TaxID=764290 RepID=A0A380JCQ8_STRDO|nr:Blp family class II bacteriocin [Streptococcus downei]EFQ57249.1 class IIb bacteriocin, lactobin A/cerein 7B family [Streptococcus downei F0415]SUN35150.1 Bacteriocin class II with double-glycine leader peptide [Streptococcus downei MFe28]